MKIDRRPVPFIGSVNLVLGLNGIKNYFSAMRPLRALVIYIVLVFLGGALLAPWLWHLAQLGAHFFPRMASAPFHRFVDRSLLILALAGLWPLLQALGATSARDIGLSLPYGQSGKLAGGLLVGLISLALVAITAICCHARTLIPDITPHKIVGTLFSATGTAAIVAVLEEILFRGGIFGGLRRVLHWPFALAISSAVYALVHFLQRTELTGPVYWSSGLALLPRMLGGFADFHALVPGFFTLTLAGILLGLAYQRSGNLYYPVGLHAGWIFCLKCYGALTVAAPGAAIWWWGSGKLFDGWLAFLVLLLALAVFKHISPGEKGSPFTIPT